MRVERNPEQVRQEPLRPLADEMLAKVKGGLKAERVQGTDPSGTGGG